MFVVGEYSRIKNVDQVANDANEEHLSEKTNKSCEEVDKIHAADRRLHDDNGNALKRSHSNEMKEKKKKKEGMLITKILNSSKRFARRTTENSDRHFLFQTRWFRRCHTAQSVIAATWSTSIVDTMVRELHHWAKLEASNLQSPTTDMRQIFLAKGQSIKAWNESSGAD
ncbi:hypothetical protein LguiB_020496 [Lonicera macranthoides]